MCVRFLFCLSLWKKENRNIEREKIMVVNWKSQGTKKKSRAEMWPKRKKERKKKEHGICGDCPKHIVNEFSYSQISRISEFQARCWLACLFLEKILAFLLFVRVLTVPIWLGLIPILRFRAEQLVSFKERERKQKKKNLLFFFFSVEFSPPFFFWMRQCGDRGWSENGPYFSCCCRLWWFFSFSE